MTRIKNFFKNNFLAGILILGPLVATYYLIKFIIGLIHSMLPPFLNPETYLGFKIPGLSLILAFMFLVIIGMLGRHYIFKSLFKWGEGLLHRVPVVSGIYAAIKKLMNTFMGGSGEQNFKNVVMVEFPRKGIYSIGFLTGTSSGETQEKTKEKVFNVFIPTTPNPTSGYFIMVPESELTKLNMKVDEAFKLIVSGGVVTPA